MGQISQTVHFRDINQLIAAFIESDIPAFAIFQYKNPIFSYVGDSIDDAANQLRSQLQMLKESNSTAVYNLRMYADIDDRKRITDKAEYNLSINFRLNEPGVFLQQPNVSSALERIDPRETFYLERIKVLEDKMDNLLAKMESQANEDDPPTFMDQVNGILQNPQAMEGVNKIIGGIMGLLPKRAAASPAIGAAEPGFDPIPILQAADPDLVADLQKLAKISQQQPAQFNMFLQMLRAIKL